MRKRLLGALAAALVLATGAQAIQGRAPFAGGSRPGFKFLTAAAAGCVLATPQSLYGSSLVAFWDPSDTSTITQSGGVVSSWTAKGSGAIAATQSTAANRPTYSATARNGKPGVVFVDSSGQQLSIAPANLPTGDMTVFFSAYMPTLNGGDTKRAFSFGSGSTGNQSIEIIRRGSNLVSEITLGSATVDWSAADRATLVNKSGTAGTFVVDGTTASTGTYNATIPNSVGYMGRGMDYPDNSPITAQMIVVANRASTTREINILFGIESWADGKNGSNLPTGSTFKTRAPCTTD